MTVGRVARRNVENLPTEVLSTTSTDNSENANYNWNPCNLVPVRKLMVWTKQIIEPKENLKLRFSIQNNVYVGKKFAWKVLADRNHYKISPPFGVLHPSQPQIITVTCAPAVVERITKDWLEIVFHTTEDNQVDKEYWEKELKSPTTDGLIVGLKFVSDPTGQQFFETAHSKTKLQNGKPTPKCQSKTIHTKKIQSKIFRQDLFESEESTSKAELQPTKKIPFSQTQKESIRPTPTTRLHHQTKHPIPIQTYHNASSKAEEDREVQKPPKERRDKDHRANQLPTPDFMYNKSALSSDEVSSLREINSYANLKEKRSKTIHTETYAKFKEEKPPQERRGKDHRAKQLSTPDSMSNKSKSRHDEVSSIIDKINYTNLKDRPIIRTEATYAPVKVKSPKNKVRTETLTKEKTPKTIIHTETHTQDDKETPTNYHTEPYTEAEEERKTVEEKDSLTKANVEPKHQPAKNKLTISAKQPQTVKTNLTQPVQQTPIHTETYTQGDEEKPTHVHTETSPEAKEDSLKPIHTDKTTKKSFLPQKTKKSKSKSTVAEKDAHAKAKVEPAAKVKQGKVPKKSPKNQPAKKKSTKQEKQPQTEMPNPFTQLVQQEPKPVISYASSKVTIENVTSKMNLHTASQLTKERSPYTVKKTPEEQFEVEEPIYIVPEDPRFEVVPGIMNTFVLNLIKESVKESPEEVCPTKVRQLQKEQFSNANSESEEEEKLKREQLESNEKEPIQEEIIFSKEEPVVEVPNAHVPSTVNNSPSNQTVTKPKKRFFREGKNRRERRKLAQLQLQNNKETGPCSIQSQGKEVIEQTPSQMNNSCSSLTSIESPKNHTIKHRHKCRTVDPQSPHQLMSQQKFKNNIKLKVRKPKKNARKCEPCEMFTDSRVNEDPNARVTECFDENRALKQAPSALKHSKVTPKKSLIKNTLTWKQEKQQQNLKQKKSALELEPVTSATSNEQQSKPQPLSKRSFLNFFTARRLESSMVDNLSIQGDNSFEYSEDDPEFQEQQHAPNTNSPPEQTTRKPNQKKQSQERPTVQQAPSSTNYNSKDAKSALKEERTKRPANSTSKRKQHTPNSNQPSKYLQDMESLSSSGSEHVQKNKGPTQQQQQPKVNKPPSNIKQQKAISSKPNIKQQKTTDKHPNKVKEELQDMVVDWWF